MDSTNFILIIRDFCSCLGSYGRIISSNFSYLELQKKVVQLILKLQLKKKANSPFILRRKGKKEPHWILDLSFYLASNSAFLQLQTQRKHFYYTTPSRHTSESYGHQKGSPADHDRKTLAKNAPTR